MGYYRDDRSGGDRGFGGRRSFGGRDDRRRSFGGDRGSRGDREMFSAICSECGKECQVPFRPTGSKPVYCSECFEKKGGGSEPRRFGGRDDRRPQNNAQLETISVKLDRILAILEPKSAKPVEEPKEKKEIEVQPEKPIVVFEKKAEKKTKKAKKEAPAPEPESIPEE